MGAAEAREAVRAPETRWSCAVEIDARLVEEAVSLAVHSRRAPGYWEEREALYEVADPEAREAGFAALHSRMFAALGLGQPLEQAFGELPILAARVAICRVVAAVRAKEEGAELFMAAGQARAGGNATVGVRLTPASFLKPAALLACLRHELFHIADMLDPEFGYDPALPEPDAEPTRQRLVIDRYRVLWDTVIDGRLAAAGRGAPGAKDLRRHELARAFAVLGRAAGTVFERWFACTRPAHAALLEYARQPEGVPGG